MCQIEMKGQEALTMVTHAALVSFNVRERSSQGKPRIIIQKKQEDNNNNKKQESNITHLCTPPTVPGFSGGV